MRVTGGTARGRRLRVPSVDGLRPSTDRVRETLFNVLGQQLDEVRVLDLFAGSGALGIEALSRGAASCTFVERDAVAARALRENLEHTGTAERADLVRADWRAALRRLRPATEAYDLALIDPPYGLDLGSEVLRELAAAGLMTPRGWFALEHASARPPEAPDGYECFRQLTMGSTTVSLFRRVEPEQDPC